VLEEDGDGGHGHVESKTNSAWIWKQQHKGLRTFKNCPRSPNLAPIENCWQPLKQCVDRRPHWDEIELIERIKEVWATKVTQESINRMVLGFRNKLKDVIEAGGKMSGH